MRASARLLIFSNEWKEEPGLSVRVHCARCYTNYVRSVGKQINSRTYTHVQLNLASILRENLRPLEQSRKIFTTKDHYGCSGRSVSCEVPPQPSSPLTLSTQLHQISTLDTIAPVYIYTWHFTTFSGHLDRSMMVCSKNFFPMRNNNPHMKRHAYGETSNQILKRIRNWLLFWK